MFFYSLRDEKEGVSGALDISEPGEKEHGCSQCPTCPGKAALAG